ncbi:MAG: hypothetical protein OXG33_13830 [Chloroflexi bacterium]|nr:hypothetical protein [Chloroflexota bacterium]
MLPAAGSRHLALLNPEPEWIKHLWADNEWAWANTYSAVLWGAVAVLGLAQLIRPRPPESRRWLHVVGWLCLTLVASLVAYEDVANRKDALGYDLTAELTWLHMVHPLNRWVVAIAPLIAVPLLAAGWTLWTAQRGHPERQLLVGLASALLIGAVVQDIEVFRYKPLAWSQYLEEGAETMGAAVLIVVLIETLVARPGIGRVNPTRRRWVLALIDLLLVAGAFLLFAQHLSDDRRSEPPIQIAYTGPVSLVEQRFRASHDLLHRIDVWAYVDGAPGRAEIFARLTPEGSVRPVRESRATIEARRFSDATAAFHFEPIPDSRGKAFTLAVGVLSGPLPYVFLGLADGTVIAEGSARVSGEPTRFGKDLAMRITSHRRFLEGLLELQPRHWWLIGEVATHIAFLWVLPVILVWRGPHGPQPRFWRCVVGPAGGISARITLGIFILTIIAAMLAPPQLL